MCFLMFKISLGSEASKVNKLNEHADKEAISANRVVSCTFFVGLPCKTKMFSPGRCDQHGTIFRNHLNQLELGDTSRQK